MRSVISFSEIRNDVCMLAIDPVELLEQVVLVVERAVGVDVHLGSREDA